MSNHFLPFLWVRGEDHAVYRNMVKAIYESNIREFCIESRPHKEFGRQQWWDDLEVILAEAEKYGMRVWILDDQHFPTGYAGGGLSKAPVELHRQYLCHRRIRVKGGRPVHLRLSKLIRPRNRYDWKSWILFIYANKMRLPKKYKDDSLLSCTAWSPSGSPVDLTPFAENNKLTWNPPGSDWSIDICSLSRNTGMRRGYINIIDKDSCRIQIDEVYEPHYEHFRSRFGSTIAGFFSDEPELGNGNYIRHGNVLGTEQSLPYSRELADMLSVRLGPNWKTLIPLLWVCHGNPAETARVRYIYMDCVTRLAEENFSKQIGTWCDGRGVEYIGHVIEDNNQHARTATSLGHFFRGLKWQTMAGIDDIGGQVFPGGEDSKKRHILGFVSDGEFYHYALGKLGSSLGELNPRMKGRSMCEVFGNYGWGAGVRLQKYLIDHFMVRGVNHFVPHAFTCKAYPDADCPPHFYAHGKNPQYRHFGELIRYGERICSLISGGRIDTTAAILYHAEAEWSGECMLMQKPARVLWDNQVDFNFVPCDVFSEREFYGTALGKKLVVNGRQHDLLIVPYSQFIPIEAAEGIGRLLENGCPVAFIDALPQGLCTGEPLPGIVAGSDVVKLDALAGYIEELRLNKLRVTPENNRLRVMHYLGGTELYYIFNEGDSTYDGVVSIPVQNSMYEYDAWNDRAIKADYWNKSGESHVSLSVEPGKSVLLICGGDYGTPPCDPLHPGEPLQAGDNLLTYAHPLTGESPLTSEPPLTAAHPLAAEPQQPGDPLLLAGEKTSLSNFDLSICKSMDYPHFSRRVAITKLGSYSKTSKRFSGFIRYTTVFALESFEQVALEITDAYEGVEVFVNDKSAGIQVVPSFVFDLTAHCWPGENKLAIEVATTLERERGKTRRAAPTGITGEVNLYVSR